MKFRVNMAGTPKDYMQYHTAKNPRVSMYWSNKLDQLFNAMEEFAKKEGMESARVISATIENDYPQNYLVVEIKKSDSPFNCYWTNYALEMVGILTLGEQYS